MTPFYISFVIFFCIGYLIVTDQSIATLFILLTKLAEVEYQKKKWWLLHNPSNIFVRWLIHRRSMKMAKEIMKEFEEKNK